MKKETTTIKPEKLCITCRQMIDYIFNLLLETGYHQDTIKKAFIDKVKNLEDTEYITNINPEFFEDIVFLKKYSIEIKSRYNGSRYFYKLNDGQWILKLFDIGNVNIEYINIKYINLHKNTNHPLLSIAPKGGPYIKCGSTNLQKDICKKLPNSTVTSIKFDKKYQAYIITL